jgi:hypothetical protein
MLKSEWPLLLPDDAKVKALAAHTFDMSEYIVDIARKEKLAEGLRPLDGGVTLHLACHARAQNIGRKAADMLQLSPDIKLDVIERCSGHGGSIGVAVEFHEIALKVGRPVARAALEKANRFVASECPLQRDGKARRRDQAEPRFAGRSPRLPSDRAVRQGLWVDPMSAATEARAAPRKRRIEASDIMPMAEYAKERKARRAAISALKRNRRVEVGPFATFYFESYETMWMQVHEMLFIERGGAEQVPGELESASAVPKTPSSSMSAASSSRARRLTTTPSARLKRARPLRSTSSNSGSATMRSAASRRRACVSCSASPTRTTVTWR